MLNKLLPVKNIEQLRGKAAGLVEEFAQAAIQRNARINTNIEVIQQLAETNSGLAVEANDAANMANLLSSSLIRTEASE